MSRVKAMPNDRNTKSEERKRLKALLEKVKLLKGVQSDRELSRVTGVGVSALQRIRENTSGSLRGENLTNLCGYLKVGEEEIISYLKEEGVSLESLVRNLSSDPLLEEIQSQSALQVFLSEVLPYLHLKDLLSALTELQRRISILIPDYLIIRRERRNEPETECLIEELSLPRETVERSIKAIREIYRESRQPELSIAERIILVHDLEIEEEELEAIENWVRDRECNNRSSAEVQ